jgi:hypothetical protein
MEQSTQLSPDPASPRSRSRGTQAVLGAAVAIVGVIAAANPESAVLRALSVAAPQLADAVPTIVTACGAVIAALSPPPRFKRRRKAA